jgi:hypothetical protein
MSGHVIDDQTYNLSIRDHGIIDALVHVSVVNSSMRAATEPYRNIEAGQLGGNMSDRSIFQQGRAPGTPERRTYSHWYYPMLDIRVSRHQGLGQTHKLPHTAFLDGGLIPAIHFGDVVALDLTDVLVHGQVPGLSSKCSV